MPTVSVYHAHNPSFGRYDSPFNSKTYKLVALVDVPEGHSERDWAYQHTNHIDCPWWENEGVTLVVEPKQRSTSVGDVVVLSRGQILRCANFGWDEIQVQNFKTAKEIFAHSSQLRTEDFIFVSDPVGESELTEDDGFYPDLVYAHLLTEGGFGVRIGSFCITSEGAIDCQTLDDEWVDDGIDGLTKSIAQFIHHTVNMEG